jgi:co-chaperonin GroES (HSP10)
MQAIQDNIIVKPVYQDKIGNIIIPGVSKFGKNCGMSTFQLYEGFIYGIVQSVGKGYKETFEGRRLQPGDKIIWQRHEGKKFFYDREEYIKLSGKWVQAVITGLDN